MALLQHMQGPQGQPAQQGAQQQSQQQPQGNDQRLQQAVTGMMAKLFPNENLQSLIGMLQEQRGNGMKPAVDAIVSSVIGLLKQGKEQGKSLPIKVVMSALLPVLAKIAQGVEQDDEPQSALLAELLTKIGQGLAQHGGQAGVLDQAQAQELQQLVSAFVERVSPHFSEGMAPEQPAQPAQPQQRMM